MGRDAFIFSHWVFPQAWWSFTATEKYSVHTCRPLCLNLGYTLEVPAPVPYSPDPGLMGLGQGHVSVLSKSST